MCFLPPNWSENTLRLRFANFGEVENCGIQMDDILGGSLFFGFVTFRTVAQAQLATAQMDGFFVVGRTLHVEMFCLRRKTYGVAEGSALEGK